MAVSHDLDELIRRRMPFPLARLYVEMLEELEPRIRFRCLIKFFVGTLKYISIVCVADYLQKPDSPTVNAELAKSLERPSAGHWMSFLRTISNHYRATKRLFHIQPLQQLLSKRNGARFAHLIQLRNAYVHPDILPDVEASRQLYDETLPEVLELVEALRFLAEAPLVLVQAEPAAEVLLMGAALPVEGGPSDRFVVRSPASGDLDVTPFLLLPVDPLLHGLLVYESLFTDRAKYVLGNRELYVPEGDEPANRFGLVRSLLGRFKSAEDRERERRSAESRLQLSEALAVDGPHVPVLHHVRRLARHQAGHAFESYTAGRRYIGRTYVERADIRKAYERLLAPGASTSGLVIVADSGVGKSNEVCSLYTRLDDHVVWLLSGRTTRARSVLKVLEDDLVPPGTEDPNLEKVLARFDRDQGEGGRTLFVILFDGLNETDDPAEAWKLLNTFLDANRYDWLKLVITCRSFAWKTLESTGVLPDRNRYVAGPDGSLATVLRQFSDDELRAALARHKEAFNAKYPGAWDEPGGLGYGERRLLSSPLVLRLVFEAYRNKEIPARFDLESVMDAFTRELVRERDLPFLEHYLMTYFFREETDVVDTAHLLEVTAGEPSGGISDPDRSDYAKLAEHILGEQVLAVDLIWRCPAPDCENHRHPLFVEPVEGLVPRCERCHRQLEEANADNRSTFSRLLGENILSTSDREGSSVVRIVFDRYFEYLMRRYCLRVKMAAGYDAAVIDELLRKVGRCGIFIEPLKSVILELWRKGEKRALYQVAASEDFAAYHVLRDLLDLLAEASFADFAAALRTALEETAFSPSLCRAAVHALLVEPGRAKVHARDTIELLIELSECPSDRVHEDAGEYLVALRRAGVDLISPLAVGLAAALGKSVGIVAGLATALRARRRLRFSRQANFFLDVVLFGLGNFFEDPVIREAIVKSGVGLVQRVLRHPVLAPFSRLLARFVSRHVARVYREKGPLPCNYWEMLFQLRLDPDGIRRAGEMFFVERGNLFDLDYEAFFEAVHSENGLVTWYVLSLLPVHYRDTSDRAKAVGYLRRLGLDGTEMDRYVAAETISLLVQRPETCTDDLVEALEAIGKTYRGNLSQLFLHPAPCKAVPESEAVVGENQERARLIRAESNPYIVPWIALRGGELHRYYLNSAVFLCALHQLRRDRPSEIADILETLERNAVDDLLRFGDDVQAGRRLVISFLVQALGLAAIAGFPREVFATIESIVRVYVTEGCDPANRNTYTFAIAATLKSIKDYHPREVLSFLDRFNLEDPAYGFLGEVRTAAVSKEKIFSKSLYGHNIYQGGFSSRPIREAFGEFTTRAAKARDVEEFFFVYTYSFMRWLERVEV